jgi:hypothetical protein
MNAKLLERLIAHNLLPSKTKGNHHRIAICDFLPNPHIISTTRIYVEIQLVLSIAEQHGTIHMQ